MSKLSSTAISRETSVPCPKSLNDVVPVDDFNRQHAKAQKELEKEKKSLKEIVERQVKEKNGGFWWDEPLSSFVGAWQII
jgi:hypothetical protein